MLNKQNIWLSIRHFLIVLIFTLLSVFFYYFIGYLIIDIIFPNFSDSSVSIMESVVGLLAILTFYFVLKFSARTIKPRLADNNNAKVVSITSSALWGITSLITNLFDGGTNIVLVVVVAFISGVIFYVFTNGFLSSKNSTGVQKPL